MMLAGVALHVYKNRNQQADEELEGVPFNAPLRPEVQVWVDRIQAWVNRYPQLFGGRRRRKRRRTHRRIY